MLYLPKVVIHTNALAPILEVPPLVALAFRVFLFFGCFKRRETSKTHPKKWEIKDVPPTENSQKKIYFRIEQEVPWFFRPCFGLFDALWRIFYTELNHHSTETKQGLTMSRVDCQVFPHLAVLVLVPSRACDHQTILAKMGHDDKMIWILDLFCFFKWLLTMPGVPNAELLCHSTR